MSHSPFRRLKRRALGGVGRRWAGVAGPVSALLIAACTVDDRTLAHAPYGDSAPETNGGAGGEAGSWGYPTATGDEYWSFDEDADGWEPMDGIETSFSDEDADDDPHSGSIAITNVTKGQSDKLTTAGASRCVHVEEHGRYRVGLEMLVPTQERTGGAGFQIQFINTQNCQGLVLDSALFPTSVPGSWQYFERTLVAPSEAQSALIWLLVAKAYNSPSFKVEFDEIHFAAE